MSIIQVSDITGANVGQIHIPDNLLVLNKGEQAVHDVIVAFQARARSGSASTLTKSQVSGSNAKPWRQKGLGRARAGLRQSPIWRGGGVVFGPHPRSYAKKVPHKVTKLAFRRALSEKVAGNCVHVIKDFTLDKPKTKVLRHIMNTLGIKGMALIVLDSMDRNVVLASRNIHGIEVVPAKDVNTCQLVRYSNVLVSESALTVLRNRLE